MEPEIEERVSIVTAIKWIKQGNPAEVPEKAGPGDPRKYMAKMQQLANQGRDLEGGETAMEQEGTGDNKPNEDDPELRRIEELYGLDNYDDDEGQDNDEEMGGLSAFDNLAVHSDPREDENIDPDYDVESDEEEDYCVHPDENLIAVGYVDSVYCDLQYYVYGDSKEVYPRDHNNLEAYPLALEWLDFNPSNPDSSGNFLAVGDFTPVISVWNGDIINSQEPSFKLGKKSKKKKVGHTEAVLSLAWNSHLRTVLASGSADSTLIGWDLNTLKPAVILRHFTDKVQTLKWHPQDPNLLLAGSCDGVVKLYDCRNPEALNKSWRFPGEVENVFWNEHQPNQFLVGTSTGALHCMAIQQEKPICQLPAHQKPITTLSMSSNCPGLLATTSEDETLKIWDLLDSSHPQLVLEKEMGMGNLLAAEFSPDHPFILALGGSKPDSHFKLQDCLKFQEVNLRFADRATSNRDQQPLFQLPGSIFSANLDDLDVEPSTSTAKIQKKKKKKNKVNY